LVSKSADMIVREIQSRCSFDELNFISTLTLFILLIKEPTDVLYVFGNYLTQSVQSFHHERALLSNKLRTG